MRAAPLLIVAVLALFAAPAQAQSGIDSYRYTACAATGGTSLVEVVAAPCAEAQAVATQVATFPVAGEASALTALGWTPLRARSTSGGGAHDVVAVRGRAVLRIRRSGAAPDLDGWQAGRELIFARNRLVGGRPVPKGAALCTSAFLVRVRSGSLGGLSAAHCGGLRSDRTVHRRNVGLRRSPQPGIILGRVQRIVTRSKPLDALVVPVPSGAGRTAVPVVDRGVSRPPWSVAGVADPTAGRAVCFTGRTSGVDRCGSIAGSRARRAERLISAFSGVIVRCTTIRARSGDSGGPVYTAPGADGRVRAVGIVTLVVGESARMCFTPLKPVLETLGARLAVASAE